MSDTLTADLENDVIFGIYGPGTRITEDRIMERFGAKRHVVRNAFVELEKRGLLVRRQNRGVEVVAFTPDEVDELYDIRIVLETAAAERTPLPADPALCDRLEEIAVRHRLAVRDMDFRAVFWLNQAFHEVQFSACDNPRLAVLIGNHARMAQPIRVVRYDDYAHMKEVIAQHFAIVVALRASSRERYVTVTREHLPASARAYRNLYERRFAARSESA